MASVLVKGSKISALNGVWECSGAERMDVRQCSWGVFIRGESDGTCFLCKPTLLPVCHPLASVIEKGTTITTW